MVLGLKYRSSANATSAQNHWGISPGPQMTAIFLKGKSMETVEKAGREKHQIVKEDVSGNTMPTPYLHSRNFAVAQIFHTKNSNI